MLRNKIMENRRYILPFIIIFILFDIFLVILGIVYLVSLTKNLTKPIETQIVNNVSGRLLWNDEPLQGAYVNFTEPESDPESDNSFMTTTDELGKFSILIQPGKYWMYYRFQGEIDWIPANSTPGFSRLRYVELPLVIEEGEILHLNDIHTIKRNKIKIIYPQPFQIISPSPTFQWDAYPFTDYYSVWIYERHINSNGIAYSYPSGDMEITHSSSITLDWLIPAYDDYYILVIAFNANNHELADGEISFSVNNE